MEKVVNLKQVKENKENNIRVFNHKEFGEVRTLLKNNEPWFVGKDIAEALGYKNVSDALGRHVDIEDKDVIGIHDSIGRSQDTPIINESGMYSLILRSQLPSAKKFKRWVTSEVLPSIRKYGAYMTEKTIEEVLLNPDTIIKLATNLKEEKEKRLELEIENMKKENEIKSLAPLANYTEEILKSKELITVNQIAKDYGMSAIRFNQLLHEMKIQYKQGKQWFLYSNIQDRGYTHSETFMIGGKVRMTTKWTQKGRMFLYKKLKEEGILPMIERGKLIWVKWQCF